MAEEVSQQKAADQPQAGGVRVVKRPESNENKTEVSTSGKEVTKPSEEKGMVKPMGKSSNNEKLKTILVSIVVVTLGLLSGYGLSQVTGGGKVTNVSLEEIADKELAVGDVVGSTNEDIFSDEGEGVLLKGGINGEGSHRILRPGGESQTIYLTSSVLDLDKFVDHKVKVWGETFDAQKAGWLMDVGRVEVLELNAEKPFEEE